MALRALQGPTGGGAPVGGTGTTNTIPRWTGPSTLGDSGITDNGTVIGVANGARTLAFNLLQISGNTLTTSTAELALQYATSRDTAIYAPASSVALFVKGTTGNVGIGTASPGSRVSVRSNTTSAGATPIYTIQANRQNSDTAGFLIGMDGNLDAALAVNGDSRSIRFGKDVSATFTEWGRFDSAGNFGLGTASPAERLHVVSANSLSTIIASTNATQAAVELRYNTSTTCGYFGTGAALVTGGTGPDFALRVQSGAMLFATGATERARIDSAGRMCIGTTTATAGRALTTVADLDVFGVRVGRGTNGVTGNTALGDGVFASGSLSGAYNVAVGYTTGAALTTGQRNTFLGGYASGSATTAQDTVSVGYASLYSVTTTGGNVAVGFEAGRYLSSASATTQATDSIFIGRDARPSGDGESNQIVIGTAARGNGSNTATLGNASTVSIHLDAKFVRLVDSYTVGTLPAAGTAGRIARVTDGDAALAWGATVVNTGAGATPYLVWDNGTNWTVFGK